MNQPVCSFGTPWPHEHCDGCEQEQDRLEAEFEAKVQAGVYDRWGYTKAEAKHRRVRQLSLLEVA